MSEKTTSFRASTLSESELDDARRLQARFNQYKTEGGTQKEFAALYEMPGGASMITQHLRMIRPISLDQARAYMRGFNCSLEEISPTLAAKVPAGASKFEKDIQQKGDQIMMALARLSQPKRQDAYSAVLELLLRYSGGDEKPATRQL